VGFTITLDSVFIYFLNNNMDFLIKAAQLLLSLSILVIVHELGHFLFAKMFKVRVEKFYLFFNPWFSLFKLKKGETEYGLGWLPLGGYVKIAGMIDESLDKKQLEQPPQPHEFRSHSVWHRFLIMIGGVLFNLICAFILFWLILFKWGESYVPAENAKYGFVFHPIANEIGLQNGDNVLKAGTFVIEDIEELAKHILLEKLAFLTIQRNDSIFDIPVHDDFPKLLLTEKVKRFAEFRIPNVVDSVISGTNAYKGGILKNDSIVSINDLEVPFFDQFSNELSNYKDELITLGLYRNNEFIQINCKVDSNGKIGYHPKMPNKFFGHEIINYGFFEAFPAGISKGINILTDYIKQFKYVFTKEGAKQLGGFGTIGSIFPSKWNWSSFWYLTAFLSLILAFMNILPIPALDGGHLLFLLYEMITRRKPGDKFMERAQVIGMVLLITLLIYVNTNDIFRWLAK